MGKPIHVDEDLDEVAQAVGQHTLVNGARCIKQESKTASEMRQTKSKAVGFHLLELPSVTSLEREAFNLKLKESLIAYEKVYRTAK